MKRILISILFILVSASTWAVWEGNAGVESLSDFTERSREVKSDMFPINTILAIENLENGRKTTAIVSGPLGIAGLVVNVSPYVAKMLSIPSDKIARVRIEITDTLSDDAFLEEKFSGDKENNKELLVAEENKPNTDEDIVLFDPASTKKYPKPKSFSKKTIPEVRPEKTAEENLLPNPNPKNENSENAYLERADLKPPKGARPNNTTTKRTSPKAEELASPSVEKPRYRKSELLHAKDTTARDNFNVYEKEEPARPVKTIDPISENSTDFEPNDSPKAVNEVTEISEAKPKEQKTLKPVTEVSAVSEPESKVENVIKAVDEVSSIVKPEKKDAKDIKAVKNVDGISREKKESEAPKPIVELAEIEDAEKTEEAKPEIVKKPRQVVEEKAFKKETASDLLLIDSEEVPITAIIAKGSESKPEKPVIKAEPYVIQTDSEMYYGNLRKGRYYLQIANYRNEDYVKSILTKHKQYPLAVEKSGSGSKSHYRVFVGPLKIDEMGAMMEQFYKFGFKDSFFKIIR